MSLSTNLNNSPYFDDFDPEKGYHRILFKPSVAVQARELTQLQTILQNQVRSFGDNILMEGTIISGCNFYEQLNLHYVKILDIQGNGAPVSMNSYRDKKLIGKTTGVTAIVADVAPGFESQSPDLNTVFVQYTGTGTSGEKVFSATETIEVRDIVSNSFIADVVAAGSVENDSIGRSYGITVQNGIIYQKGFFIGVDEQSTIISKYTDIPNNLVVGFETNERIINSNADASLLDNAQGSPNENAPGADRLELKPALVVKTVVEANELENFLSIQEYKNGRVVRKNTTTQYNQIFDAIRNRTSEESGDYTIRDFDIRLSANTENAEILDVNIDSGVAYVGGRRVELLNKYTIPLRKSTEFGVESQQNITTNYGNYFIVDEYMGSIDFSTMQTISLHSSTEAAFTAGAVSAKDAGTQIGTAKVRSIIHHSGAKGTASAQYRVYVFDVRMESGENFDNVRSIYFDGSNKGVADLVLESGNAVIKETKYRTPIFEIGREAIRDIPSETTDYVFRTVKSSMTADSGTGDIIITLTGSEEWPYGIGTLNNTQKNEIDLICRSTQSPYVENTPINLDTSTVTVTSSQSMTISLADAPASNMDVSAYYNVKKEAASPAGKELKTIFVKIDADTNDNGVDGPYCLGVADVVSIENIWQGANYSTGNSDVTGQFSLNKNQRDAFYGLSEITPSRSHTIGSTDKLLVKLKVFKETNSGSFSKGYFSVDSYPIDDDNVSDSTIKTEEIPTYISDSGREFNMRNSIDFRPYAANTSTYSATAGSATINPSSALTFGNSQTFFPAPNKNMETDYRYYLGRRDILFIDDKGEFIISEGNPSETPAPPSEPGIGLVLAVINIPPFPSLPKRVADEAGKPLMGVSISARDSKRYTMKDIGGIDRRLKSLEYYVSLNALEQEAVNMLITDSSGSNRFKNGVFVDNFRDLNIADVRHPEFEAAIELGNSEITPKVDILPLDLKAHDKNSWTGVKDYGDIVSLTPSSEENFKSQPYATTFRNCVTNFYNFTGVAKLTPEYDNGYETTRAPDTTIDLSKSFSDFTEELGKIVPLSTTNSSTQQSTQRSGDRVTTTTTSNVSRTELDTVGETTKPVGDFVTDVRFTPFMRSRNVNVVISGLRPNTEHFFYFDEKPVSVNVAPAQFNSSGNVIRSGPFGSSVVSGNDGSVVAIFKLPENTFYVGDRVLKVLDVDELSAEGSASSKAKATYHAFNISLEKTSVSTRIPEFGTSVNETTVTEVSNRTLPPPFVPSRGQRGNGGGGGGGGDPISQTFMIDRNESISTVIVIDKIDLFFKSKDQSKGVTVQIREVVNGYPGSKIIPFSSVRKSSSDVNTSDDASVVTTFDFDGPVMLMTDKEYCFVVIPDGNSPDYNIFIGKTGQTDYLTGEVINQDTDTGTLFTSTNNRAWTPYQDENIKYRIPRNDFEDSEGSISLSNKNSEFLAVSNVVGSFRQRERIALIPASNNAGSISMSSTSNEIVGSGTDFDNLQIGDTFAAYYSASEFEILEINNISSNTSLTVTKTPDNANASANYYSTVTGEISYIDTNAPAMIVVDESNAKSGRVFESGRTIVGEDSGAQANIVSVDNRHVNYIQPGIRRSNTTETRTSLSGTVFFEDTGTSSNVAMVFGDSNHFNTNKVVIKSRSNEILDGTGKSFVLNIDMKSNGGSTPTVDYGISNIMAHTYNINGDITGETGSQGLAIAKYVAKPVQLADDLDADDIKIFLTGYRPPSTDINVYVKFQNTFDPTSSDSIPWTKLSIKSETSGFSSNSDRFNYKEFEYGLDSKPSADFIAGEGAALNEDNNDIVRYISSDGVVYDRFKYYRIKVVMTSQEPERIPRLKDIRAIALS